MKNKGLVYILISLFLLFNLSIVNAQTVPSSNPFVWIIQQIQALFSRLLSLEKRVSKLEEQAIPATPIVPLSCFDQYGNVIPCGTQPSFGVPVSCYDSYGNVMQCEGNAMPIRCYDKNGNEILCGSQNEKPSDCEFKEVFYNGECVDKYKCFESDGSRVACVMQGRSKGFNKCIDHTGASIECDIAIYFECHRLGVC